MDKEGIVIVNIKELKRQQCIRVQKGVKKNFFFLLMDNFSDYHKLVIMIQTIYLIQITKVTNLTMALRRRICYVITESISRMVFRPKLSQSLLLKLL